MKRRRKRRQKSPLIRLVGLEAAAAAAGIAGSPAMAAPGDLDPAFGDVGRQSSVHRQQFPMRMVGRRAGGRSVLLGGGGEY